ncbi:ATP-dependent DNA ligase [Arthrobacter bambusae]|uniref:ATP-dependent DNA ligase n=1 Tax=Arthrobacter bambusae TaxID=1338426 RepID=UPI002786D135|nr:ATP-dependent DNA ligase [Arthrobacter bambusae]MDQ0030689.1 bifunctional non-homologous end joining protein LigD [Arthrobacter bambusae]MDQ0099024.1 bifunctional non-homologous end joining protein LigD [Arthrobacter bambusae]
MASSQKERVNVEGHQLTLTNLGKIIYPETGTTKAEVLEYYAAVAPFLIPAAANRPATRKRWVNGVGTATHPGQMFFQKNLDQSTPSWVPRVTIQHSDHSNVYPLVNNLATLTWLAQIAALEIHVPQWQVDADGTMLPPDRLVLDLDPGPGTGLPECVEVAKLARSILQDIGLDPVPVTSGSKGIHLYAGLDGTRKWEQVSAFAHELARSLEADHPDLVVSDMKKTLRNGKVLVDWSQNSGNKTTIVPYSLRGRAHPMVAAPRTWRELASPKLEHLDFTAVMKRVKEGKDPFAAVAAGRSGHAPGHGGAGTAVERTGVNPRLASYVDKRDPQRTPEPFPAAGHHPGSRPPQPDAEPNPPGGIFVIQEHHARRFHLDFRLEHNGVLASWALPRGVPDTPAKNHLAVRTEDHPMEYAEFAGIIPKGEYGAGTVSIWDSGEFECEKWRDGKEVIATLTGKPGGGLQGTRRFALIHTGESPSQWLIHLMKDKPGHRAVLSPGAQPQTNGTPSYAPMLATSGTTADVSSGDWLFELKWDGFRAIVSSSGGKISVISRSGIDMTATYPELADPRYWPRHDFVADGEIVALSKDGRPSFELLQKRMNLFKPGDVERARAAVPVQLMLFDLLYDAGSHGSSDLTSLPLSERRDRLEAFRSGLPAKGSPIHVSEVLDHDLDDLLASAAELGLEGVMAKRAESRYQPGRRSRSWVKLKLERMQEVVVGGWRPGAGARLGTIGALLVGIPDGDKLRYAGRVGTGFKDWQLRDILKRLEGIDRRDSPFHDIPAEDARGAQWVSPELVGEVTFGDWTGTGRMRHPVWRGWRPDKSPEDVDTLTAGRHGK